MADRKNQHFVPRVLMRPFTKNAEDKSINLYNIRANRLIPNGPVKGQCARHYWYGEDGILEDMLGKIEGMFGRNRLQAENGDNEDDLRAEIRRFMYLQHWRTAKAAERLKASWEQMNAASWAPKQEVPDAKQLLLSSMRFGLQSRDMIEDLKVRFVENNTPSEFVLGDDPAVMLNRFAHDKLGDGNFGVASAGLIIVMPLTPRLSIIAYDGQVYTLNLTEGRLMLTKSAEVDAFNEIQMLAGLENIYFRNWDQGEHVRRQFLSVRHRRKPHATVQTFVPDGDDPDFERYKPGTVEQGRAAKQSLIALTFSYPQPEHWIAGMRYRPKPKCFYNGTGIGHVRKAEWLKRGGMPIPQKRSGSAREKPILIRTQ